ncbi:MAG: hypothetical protein M1826_006470 [Phylliscum demangeonii]|nr:MAG: hypothetical protein M1826_006470 [Phylliscum demangeonii]
MPIRRRPPRAGTLAELPPLKIITQIVLLQTGYYLSATVLTVFTVLAAGQRFQLGLLWDWGRVRGDNAVGWTLAVVWLLNSLVGAILLLLLVSRSKLVLDFALTMHGIHLVAVLAYTRSVPTHLLWWALQAASVAIMASLGVWACRWRELRPINFGGDGGRAPAPAVGSGPITMADLEEDGGRSTGGGGGDGGASHDPRAARDGVGSYELVGMKANGAA